MPRGLATVYFPSVGRTGLAAADAAAANDQPLPAPFPAVQVWFEQAGCAGTAFASLNPTWYYLGSLVFTGARAFVLTGIQGESMIAVSTMLSDGICQDTNPEASGHEVEEITLSGYPFTAPVRMVFQ